MSLLLFTLGDTYVHSALGCSPGSRGTDIGPALLKETEICHYHEIMDSGSLRKR